MNTGLQDAYNLAWKLALVGKGQARSGAARLLRGGARYRSRNGCSTPRTGFQVGRVGQWLAGLLRKKFGEDAASP
jgi:hypothetical protein